MNCPYCLIEYDPKHGQQCPHCGCNDPDDDMERSGVLRTSTILIAAGKGGSVLYRSVEEVPEPLRRILVESTNGQNSGTIYIADQRGRERIALALRNLPGAGRSHDEALAPVLTRFSAGLTPPAPSCRRARVSLSALLCASMILVITGAMIWLVGGRGW